MSERARERRDRVKVGEMHWFLVLVLLSASVIKLTSCYTRVVTVLMKHMDILH